MCNRCKQSESAPENAAFPLISGQGQALQSPSDQLINHFVTKKSVQAPVPWRAETDVADEPKQAAELVADGNSHRFTVEVNASPYSVRFLDADSGQPLIEFTDEAIREFVDLDALDQDTPNQGLISALSSMSDFTRELARTDDELKEEELTEAAEAPKGKRTTARKKLWELPDKLRCPVIGTCLDVSDLRKMARNGGVEHKGMSDYQMHSCYVGAATSKNHISHYTHKYLDKKHASYVRRFAKARNAEQLEALWDEALAVGETPGAFWALLTHGHCSEDLVTRAYEEIHMLSHQIGAGQRADVKRLAETQQKLEALENEFSGLQSRMRQQLVDREERLLDNERQLSQSEAENRRLQTELASLKGELRLLKDSEKRQDRAKLLRLTSKQKRESIELTRDRDQWRETCQNAQAALQALESDHDNLKSECDAMQRLLGASEQVAANCPSSACSECPNLNNKQVLCVGGRNQLLNRYRELVKQSNGRFEHYDGGLEDSRQRLEALLSSADVVLCATDCVSHDAFYRMKRFCKRRNVPYVLMPSSGLSSFARALASAADEDPNIEVDNTTQALPLNLLRVPRSL